MKYTLKEFSKIERDKVIVYYNRWHIDTKITSMTWIDLKKVRRKINKYIYNKKYAVHNWKKKCRVCDMLKLYTEEFFIPTWRKKQDWTKCLRPDCKICHNLVKKNKRKMLSPEDKIILNKKERESSKRTYIKHWNKYRYNKTPEERLAYGRSYYKRKKKENEFKILQNQYYE